MAIDSYDTLKSTVEAWCERTGDTAFAAQADNFIQLAETELDLALTGYQRQVSITLTTDNEGYVDLPSGFVSIVSLSYLGRPVRYQLSGSKLFAPDAKSRPLALVAVTKFAPLSSSNPSNWLLVESPNAYLFMTMAMGEAFNRQYEQAATLNSKALQLISGLSKRSMVAQYGQASLKIPGGAP